MNRERVLRYVNELSAMINQVRGIERSIQQETVKKDMAEQAGQLDPKQAVGIARHIADAQKAAEKMAQMVCDKANRKSVEGAEDLLTDLATRLDAAQGLHKEWRARLAQLELLAKLGKFDENPDAPGSRQSFEEVVADCKAQYEAQLELAADLVPNKAVLISVA